MTRRPAHPLSRWAAVIDSQREDAARFATTFASGAPALSRLPEPFDQLSELILGDCFHYHSIEPEGLEVSNLSWTKALTAAFRDIGHLAPVVTSEQVVFVALHLHALVTPSALHAAADAFPTLTWKHLSRLVPYLRRIDLFDVFWEKPTACPLDVGDEEYERLERSYERRVQQVRNDLRKDATWNHEILMQWLNVTQSCCYSPKKLEWELKRAHEERRLLPQN
ncbi:hypothetical protein [Roseimaritima ulvae]|uniref:Uncharacterized protein n=1 Tax=Roseimaritima ulvae TaxID=980254 RepID=A0A5B9QU99_9BACT|nr:hypothetical protein [Roseimaritima ulvae]QEG41340.1 hypothetical protein UC8_33590 [Roseimaritima ulvae]